VERWRKERAVKSIAGDTPRESVLEVVDGR
jgi:hypothetical protein